MPVVAGARPYRVRGAAYFDGLFWSSTLAFVQWRGFVEGDAVVKVSSLSLLGSDVRPARALLPPWWGLLPPPRAVLEGLMALGFDDAARYFAEQRRAHVAAGFALDTPSALERAPDHDAKIAVLRAAVRAAWTRAAALCVACACAAVYASGWALAGTQRGEHVHEF